MKVIHATGVEGARHAEGITVVIDVLRAFTVSAYALARGARECLLVDTIEEARALAAGVAGSFISAEVDTLPVPGIAISNSPTQITQAECRGRTLVQRTSAGTPVINAAQPRHPIYAASLVVARATAEACLSRAPEAVTLVASADFPEDHACALYIAAVLERKDPPPMAELLEALYGSDRYRRLSAGDWPGFPRTDLELALRPDRFDFAMPAAREPGHVRLTAQR